MCCHMIGCCVQSCLDEEANHNANHNAAECILPRTEEVGFQTYQLLSQYISTVRILVVPQKLKDKLNVSTVVLSAYMLLHQLSIVSNLFFQGLKNRKFDAN